MSALSDQYQYFHTASTTTGKNIVARPGKLHGITINNPGTTMTVTIADTTTTSGGTTIAAFSSPTVGSYIYDAMFNNGLAVIVGGTAGDITLSYA